MKFFKKLVICTLAMALTISGFPAGIMSPMETTKEVKAADNDNTTADDGSTLYYPHFLKANGTVLRDNYGKGAPVYLRGVNAGGYMLQELWMCPTENSDTVKDQTSIINTLTKRFGADKARELINTYEENYWTEQDFKNCADLGLNCIRLPIWYRNLVDENDTWYEDAFDRIDWFVETAGRYGMYVIIDMHGAYGSQNGSDHSGVDGGESKKDASQFFFGDNAADNQEKFYKMWEKIAEHYKGNPVVAGYDLLNEPYSTYRYDFTDQDETDICEQLWDIYNTAYNRVRAIDKEHVIIMEEVWRPDDLPNPNGGSNKNRNSNKTYTWENVMYEDHNYLYENYDNENNAQINSMSGKIENINDRRSRYNVPYLMGEFNYMSKDATFDEGIKLLNDNNLSWTLWSYKVVGDGTNNWGLYNQDITKADLENDDFDTIKSKWSNTSMKENTGITQYVKKYTPGKISNLTETSDAVRSESGIITVTGGTESATVTLSPEIGQKLAKDTQYKVLVDGKEMKTISPRIEAENYNEESGTGKDENKDDQYGTGNTNNIGATHNGDWTMYKDVDFGNGEATEFTARYAIRDGSVGTNPKLEIYVDSMDSNKVGTLDLVKGSNQDDWKYFRIDTVTLNKPIKGKHNIYIKYVVNENDKNVCNLDWFCFSQSTFTLEGLTPGNHTVTVERYDGSNTVAKSESVTVNVYTDPDNILTSDAVGVEGFQIRTNDRSSVAFRTVCKAPNKGSEIEVNGIKYKVKDIGTIYTLDPDTSGDAKNSKLDSSYTILDAGKTFEASDIEEGCSGYKYKGQKLYNNEKGSRTFGYLATEKGIFTDWNVEDTENTYYVRTLTNMENYLQNTFHVRAFVEAEDPEGNTVIIYGTGVADMSIPEVAAYLYKNSLASNYQGHKYLYEKILNKIPSTNPYYRNTTEDYGWNDNLYTPEEPTTVVDTVIVPKN